MASAAPASTPRKLAAEWLVERVRHSLALQISLTICGATLLLMVAGAWMVHHLLGDFTVDVLPPFFTYIDGMACIKEDVLQARRAEFAARTWRIVVITLIAGAAVAGLLAWWITQRVLHSAQRLADTASRISGRSLQERLIPARTPSELQPVARSFNQMMDRLEESFTRLSSFSSDVAHDLRVPLQSLTMATQVTLAKPRSADEYRAALEATVPVYETMVRLVDNILFLARAEQGQTPLHATRMDLVQRLTTAAEFFEILAEERGLALDLRIDGAGTLWADDTMFLRALANLLTNAIRHARDGSTVVLSATGTTHGGWEIAVANEGEPITPELQARIFERNYRGAGNRRDTARSGLGLAIVKSTMALHGGSVRVESGPGRPTVFTLAFPPPPADASPQPA